MTKSLCLKCEKNDVCNEPRHWKLCRGCYDRMFCRCDPIDEFSYAEIDAYKKKFFKIYKHYGEDNVLHEKFTDKGVWLGIRPALGDPVLRHGQDPHGHKCFAERIDKFLQAKCIKKALYNFEWKWDDDMPYGLHSHLILIGDVKHINQHINRQKEKWWNLNPQQRHPILTEECLIDKIKYMNGETFDEDKNEEKEKDKAYRRKLGFHTDFMRYNWDLCDVDVIVKEEHQQTEPAGIVNFD